LEKVKRNQYEFDKRKYDHIHLQVPKGQKAAIQVHAQRRDESLNGFVNRAINETVERDGGQAGNAE
jgi:predicted HicB family RNase H-like nuclease